MPAYQTALITGASSGFGTAIARDLAQAGYRLILLARRRERLQILQEELMAKTAVQTLQVDLCNLEQIHTGLETLPPDWQVDVLVNNAGLALGLESAPQAHWQDWETMIATNITGLTYITRQLMPQMVARNRGHIVNIGSVAGNWPYPGGNVYGATKAYVQQFSRNLRCDLLGTRVRVTNIEPGIAETEFSQVRFKGDNQRAQQVYENTQALESADIAAAVAWVIAQPEHVNVNTMEIMPTDQAWAPFNIYRHSSQN